MSGLYDWSGLGGFSQHFEIEILTIDMIDGHDLLILCTLRALIREFNPFMRERGNTIYKNKLQSRDETWWLVVLFCKFKCVCGGGVWVWVCGVCVCVGVCVWGCVCVCFNMIKMMILNIHSLWLSIIIALYIVLTSQEFPWNCCSIVLLI